MNGLKVHAAALPPAEFTGVIGNLRGARFGATAPDEPWRPLERLMNIAMPDPAAPLPSIRRHQSPLIDYKTFASASQLVYTQQSLGIFDVLVRNP
jgi:hypothetical protein